MVKWQMILVKYLNYFTFTIVKPIFIEEYFYQLREVLKE